MPKVCPVCGTSYADPNKFCPDDGSVLRVVEAAENLVGSVVADRYLVTDLLGEGGMGKVYLARHVRLPQQAAIKILHADLVRDPMAVARFNREASNASQIEAENVARVYDYGETADGLVYLAMEYVPGRTLRQIIEAEGPLAPRRSAELVRQIAAGLDAAHGLTPPLIHRDLKPDNILVMATPGGRERVKVVDFGIAKAFGADDHALTRTGFVVGTPEFMSPEQLLGEPLDPRSDVYALALVAFECLTGTLPFEMTTPERARMARLVEQPRHLLDSLPGVSWPESMEEVFESGLSRDRDGRPRSAGDFAEALALAIDEAWPGVVSPRTALPTPPGRALRTPPARAAAPAPPPPPRRRMVAATAVLVAVLVVGGGAVLATRAGDDAVAPASGVAASPQPLVDVAAAATPAADARPAPAPPVTPAERPRDAATRDAATRVADVAGGEAVVAPKDDARGPAGTLDSLVRALDGENVDATAARGLARSMRDLLPRLGRDEKVRAHLGLVRASILTGDVVAACDALRAATASARRPAQQAEIKRLDEQLGCE